jgi:hypothetical protein
MHRSHRCPCSVRALEAFVRDVAGLELGQRRLNTAFRGPSAFQSRPLRFISQSHAPIPSLDDAYVPFENTVGTNRHATFGTLLQPQSTDATEPFDPSEELTDRGDLEPEITINENPELIDPDPLAAKAHQPQHTDERPIDAVFLPDLRAFHSALDPSHTTSQRLNILSSRASTPTYPGKNARKKARKAAQASENNTMSPVLATPPARKVKEKRALPKKSSEPSKLPSDPQPTPLDEENLDVASLLASATGPKPVSKAKADKIALAIKMRMAEEKAERKAAALKILQDQAAAKQAQKERNRNKERWQVEKAALQDKFGEQDWKPRKRISPDALAGIRALHAKSPEIYSTPVLAEHFKITPEAIRRILKSKWQPNEDEAEDRRERWEKRGQRKWAEMAEQGIRPPKKWRDRGVGKVGPGQVPPWKRAGQPGERWIESANVDTFIMAGDRLADEAMAEYEDDGIADRIL